MSLGYGRSLRGAAKQLLSITEIKSCVSPRWVRRGWRFPRTVSSSTAKQLQKTSQFDSDLLSGRGFPPSAIRRARKGGKVTGRIAPPSPKASITTRASQATNAFCPSAAITQQPARVFRSPNPLQKPFPLPQRHALHPAGMQESSPLLFAEMLVAMDQMLPGCVF